VLLASLIPLGAPRASPIEPRLAAIALVFGLFGIVTGATWGARTGDRTDVATAGFAGGLAGLFTAAVGSALIKSVESILGSWSTSPLVVLLFWVLLGAGIAGLSCLALPHRAAEPKPEPTP
jgi:drug/metabolite transporter (DMT)-like permease